jgi:hypothetical protein
LGGAISAIKKVMSKYTLTVKKIAHSNLPPIFKDIGRKDVFLWNHNISRRVTAGTNSQKDRIAISLRA